MIRLISRKNIDDKLWNGVVHFATNDFPYAYTWFLDQVAENWEGLVWGKYEMVMPLVFNTKWGIQYLYQPFFTQQLGIFASKRAKIETVNKFLEMISEKYKYADLQINFLNQSNHPDFQVSSKINLTLSMAQPYESIAKNYSNTLKRNLKKAKNQNLQILNNVQPEKLVAFYAANTGAKVPGFNKNHIHILHRIIYNAMHYNMGIPIAVYNSNNEMIACNFFVFSKNRVVNLLPASSPEGLEKHAMPFLLDYFFLTLQNKPLIFDFEGSMIEGIARFYQSFGAVEQNYFHLKINKLPFFLKFFKS